MTCDYQDCGSCLTMKIWEVSLLAVAVSCSIFNSRLDILGLSKANGIEDSN